MAPFLWAALILAASSLQELRTWQQGVAIRDKLAHFGEYFVFGWLLARALGARSRRAGREFLVTVLVGMFLGAADEFYQGFVPGRERDFFDFLADVAGAAAGWYFRQEDKALGDSHGAARDA